MLNSLKIGRNIKPQTYFILKFTKNIVNIVLLTDVGNPEAKLHQLIAKKLTHSLKNNAVKPLPLLAVGYELADLLMLEEIEDNIEGIGTGHQIWAVVVLQVQLQQLKVLLFEHEFGQPGDLDQFVITFEEIAYIFSNLLVVVGQQVRLKDMSEQAMRITMLDQLLGHQTTNFTISQKKYTVPQQYNRVNADVLLNDLVA